MGQFCSDAYRRNPRGQSRRDTAGRDAGRTGNRLHAAFIAGAYLADGQLEAVLQDHVRSSQRIYALHSRNRNLAPKVAAFVEFVSAAFQPAPPWEAAPGSS